ncbi:MAG: hypothetical protein JKY53_10180 [Flavobacteriales bacterium]|nr:hypothetical protein [Flavobacteriales bacterium]
MMQTIKILTFLIITLFTFQAKADSWTDPSWKEMVDSSDVIALIEYSSNGEFRAKAKVIKIFKGKVGFDEIWISGFSNRFGPIDNMKIGDRYIVFLNNYDPTERTIEYWADRIKEEPELTPYFEALKSNKAFYIWSPTSGDLSVKGKKVQYDLLQTTFYGKQKYFSLKEFEQFLFAINNENNSTFQNSTLKKVENNISKNICAQYLMMLYLSSYESFQDVYYIVFESKNEESNFALAKLLGQVNNEKSRQLLVKLLDSKNSIVQGEAVRQLANEDPDFIGSILLSKLQKAGEEGIYPQNIMDPVMNRVDGGKIEIIKTLGKLKYKPAIPQLLPLLKTENEYLFELTIDVLNQLESKDYVPYLNYHLENGTRDLILDICYIITENELTECIPSLMQFVSTHDKSIHPSMEYTISKYSGLSHFKTKDVEDFLYSDFLTVLEMEGGGTIDNKMDWIEEYMEVFAELKIEKAKPLFYDFMFYYFGFNNAFKANPKLFEQKLNLEDSISSRIREIALGDSIKEIDVLAFIKVNNKKVSIDNYTVRVIIPNSSQFDHMFSKLDSNGFLKNHILMTAGSSTHSHGAIEIRRFGDGIMRNFLNYISKYPDKQDIEFLENLKKYDYATSEYDQKNLDEYISTAKENLKK